MPTNDHLQALLLLDRSSPEFPNQLCAVLDESSFGGYIADLKPNPLLELIEYIDKALDVLSPTSVAFRRALRKLQGVCASRGVLPQSHALLANQLNVSEEPFASGGYSDVFKGTLSGSEVCVKELRVASTSNPEQAKKMLHREAVMWKRLTHANIVPFKGVTLDPLRIVSEWMSGGDLTSYISQNPQANRINLLTDVAKGLNYLHLCDVVHGDLKGPNILVDDSGCARIADFGLARNQEFTSQTNATPAHTARWAAPEILRGERVASKEADVFAFAMVIVEAFTGVVPFHLQSSVVAMVQIISGKRPSRPEHAAFTSDLWELVQRCWNQESRSRPEMSEVLQVLVNSYSSSERDSQSAQPLATVPFSDPLRRMHALEISSLHFPEQLARILEEEEFRKSTQSLKGERLALLVNDLDGFLDILDPADPAFSKCQRELRRICGAFEILPKSHTILGSLLHVGTSPIAFGGFADVYKGIFNFSDVCIKRARTYSTDNSREVQKLFYREAIVWKRLVHPNIVPFRGLTVDPLQLISDWMPGGDLVGYVNQHPGTDRLRLLDDIAQGLHYLHSRNVIHGDLKGPNILVDAIGRARITDFGLAAVSRNRNSIRSTSDNPGYAARWTAPEILNEKGTQSKAADVFSFAMVMIEVFTGAAPFKNSAIVTIIVAIIDGKRPPRPVHAAFTDELWVLAKRCWEQEPHLRPEMTDVLQILRSSGPRVKSFPEHVPDPISPLESEGGSASIRAPEKMPSLHSPPGPFERLISLDRSSHQFRDQVADVLYGQEYQLWVRDIGNDDAVRLVDFLDEALDALDPVSPSFRKCLRELRHICAARTVLPTSYALSSQVLVIGRQPFASGGSGDVYEGVFNNLRVCVKRVRVLSKDGPQETFFKEAVMWKRLQHKNILPLLGITLNPLQLISEWMPGGDLTSYIAKHPDADRLGLLSDVSEGLYFLHYRNMVHGDLKGSNILVDGNHRAQLTDFGLATVTQNLHSIRSTSEHGGHTARWTAPEILNDVGTYSKEADVFSFAMVMIEAFTGAVPFSRSLPAAAMLAIMGGKRPPRPTHRTFTPYLWALMQRCWDQDPLSRPEASEIWRVLTGTEPPPLEPHFYGIDSASTLNIGLRQQPLAPPFPQPGIGKPLSLQNTSSMASVIVNPVDGPASRRTSKRETPKKEPSIMNGQAGNRSRHDLVLGTKSHNQSRLDLGNVPQGNEGSSLPQTRNGLKEPSFASKDHTWPSHSNRGPVALVPEKRHGLWCRLKRVGCF